MRDVRHITHWQHAAESYKNNMLVGAKFRDARPEPVYAEDRRSPSGGGGVRERERER